MNSGKQPQEPMGKSKDQGKSCEKFSFKGGGANRFNRFVNL